MPNIEQALRDFATRYQGIKLLSTGATVVPYGGVLYNVEGSTRDPDIDGANWKELLIAKGINGDCYVTDPLPDRDDTSHPDFGVGGHMTPNASGRVPLGGTCYLMPLCKWHNNPARNGTAFAHEETRMLKLTGYMEGELAATFAVRAPGDAPYRLVGVEGDGVAARTLGMPLPPVHLFNAGIARPASYLVFRRVEEGGVVHFVIEESRFPDR